ncbi:MAG TPA: SpoIIE family protein phosphatase [Actinomycetota bacterium]|nr:SpoIIE family protein phosphatase [Actinomycetota bacterium]
MEAEEALESFYGALIDDAEELYDRAPCGYLTTAPDGTILKANQTFLTWTGYRREELVSRRRLSELLTPGGRIYHETHYAPMLQMQGSVREIALEIVTADGRRVPALMNSVLERDSAGAPVVIRTVIFDATERRKYEQELLKAKERAEASEQQAKLLVRTLQQTLIPPEPPEVPGLDVAAVYRPAEDGSEVGGDFYDVFQIGPGDWAFVVGDVRGKGVQAAVVTALARYTIRAGAVSHDRPSQVLGLLNEVLLRHSSDRFCTAALLRLRQREGVWVGTVSCGGHPLPLRARKGSPAEPVGVFGTLLGDFENPKVHDTELVLEPGDGLVIYTDGVTEGRGTGDYFGEERLEAAVEAYAGSARTLTDGILSEVLQFQAGLPRDDIVVVAVQVPDSL